MMWTEAAAHKELDRLDALYFGCSLPEIELRMVNELRLSRKDRSRCYGTADRINPDHFSVELWTGTPEALRSLKLMHEIVHTQVWPAGHRSAAWKREVQRLAEAGFLLEVI